MLHESRHVRQVAQDRQRAHCGHCEKRDAAQAFDARDGVRITSGFEKDHAGQEQFSGLADGLNFLLRPEHGGQVHEGEQAVGEAKVKCAQLGDPGAKQQYQKSDDDGRSADEQDGRGAAVPGAPAAAGVGHLEHGADEETEESDARQSRDAKGGAPGSEIPRVDGEVHVRSLRGGGEDV